MILFCLFCFLIIIIIIKGTANNTMYEKRQFIYISDPEKVDKFTHTFLTDYPDGVLTNITWQQPCAINGPLNNTMIKISGYFTKEHDNETRTEFSGRNSYLVTKLKHSYKYTISVWLQLQDNEGAEGLYEITTPTGRKCCYYI